MDEFLWVVAFVEDVVDIVVDDEEWCVCRVEFHGSDGHVVGCGFCGVGVFPGSVCGCVASLLFEVGYVLFLGEVYDVFLCLGVGCCELAGELCLLLWGWCEDDCGVLVLGGVVLYGLVVCVESWVDVCHDSFPFRVCFLVLLYHVSMVVILHQCQYRGVRSP